MERFIDHLIVDAAGFLNLSRLEMLANAVYTIRDVVGEVKDKKTLEQLHVLPYELNFLSPTSDDLKLATNLAKTTGDYPALSLTDVRLIAAAFQLARLHGGFDKLKSDLSCDAEENANGDAINPTNNLPVGFYRPTNTESPTSNRPDLKVEPSGNVQKTNSVPESGLKSLSLNGSEPDTCTDNDFKNQSDDEPDSSDNVAPSSDSDDGWITPSNLARFQQAERPVRRITVACLTNDFAVQNVLKHAGMPIISANGSVIKRLNTYVLRCFACLKLTSVMTSKFCPECGNQTLKRVAFSVNEDGTKQIHISKRRTINTKGFNKPIPLFHGGKHSNNPILCADQPMPQNRLSRKALQKLNVLDADYVTRDSPFLEKDIYSRSALLGVRKLTSNKTKRKR